MPTTPSTQMPPDPGTAVAAREVSLALRNTLRLGASLAVTLGVAFLVRFWMPRYLGPEAFGLVYFAEEFAAAFFVIGTLGFESYIHKEVSTRPELGSEVFGTITAIRALVGLGILGAMALTLHGMGKSAVEWRLVGLFAAGQVLFVHNNSLGALLQAVGQVRELAWVKAWAKVLWGVGIVAGLLWDRDLLEVVALSFVATEAIRTPFLMRAARRHLGLRLVLRRQAMRMVLAASLPYFLNYVAHRIYGKIGVSLLSYLATDREVGFYGAASNVTAIVFLILPLLNAVIIPMGARIAQTSEDTASAIMRGTVRMVLVLTVPMALLLALNAPVVVPLLFTDSYAPAVTAMRVLTPLVPLTYVCSMLGSHLVQLGRVWSVTTISGLGLLVNPLLNLALIVPVWRALGDGGAGLAASVTTVLTELVVAVALFVALGRQSWDRELSLLVARLIALCAGLTLAHPWLGRLGLWAIPVETVLYVAAAVPLGALPLRAMLERVLQATGRRRPPADRPPDLPESP